MFSEQKCKDGKDHQWQLTGLDQNKIPSYRCANCPATLKGKPITFKDKIVKK